MAKETDQNIQDFIISALESGTSASERVTLLMNLRSKFEEIFATFMQIIRDETDATTSQEPTANEPYFDRLFALATQNLPTGQRLIKTATFQDQLQSSNPSFFADHTKQCIDTYLNEAEAGLEINLGNLDALKAIQTLLKTNPDAEHTQKLGRVYDQLLEQIESNPKNTSN